MCCLQAQVGKIPAVGAEAAECLHTQEQSQLGRRASAELFGAGSEGCWAVSCGFATLISETSDPCTTPHTTAYRQALASRERTLINNQRTITARNKLTNSNIKSRFNRNPGPYVLFNKKNFNKIIFVSYFLPLPETLYKHLATFYILRISSSDRGIFWI